MRRIPLVGTLSFFYRRVVVVVCWGRGAMFRIFKKWKVTRRTRVYVEKKRMTEKGKGRDVLEKEQFTFGNL